MCAAARTRLRDCPRPSTSCAVVCRKPCECSRRDESRDGVVCAMTTYFLSYARLDERVALRVADALIAAGVSVWVDQYDIRPSQHWDRAVETAVRGCEGMVVILSPRSADS